MTLATLSQLQDVDDFCRAIGVGKDRVLDYADATSQKVFYNQLSIPKRGKNRRGQFRVVYEARNEWLSGMHRSIAMLVANSVTFDEHVQGFVRNRSIKSNASMHLGASTLLHADIKDFFDVITVAHVEHAFVAMGTKLGLARVIAKASTIDGVLSQGTRCSPTLANAVCRRMDEDLLQLAGTCDAQYTRYADDIAFSGKVVPDEAAVTSILRQHGFHVRPKSFVTQRKGKTQFVTGLCVADPTQPRLQKRLKRRLRLIAYYVGKFGSEDHFENHGHTVVSDESQLNGMMWFVKGIEPAFGAQLAKIMGEG